MVCEANHRRGATNSLGHEPVHVEHLLDLLGFFGDLAGRLLVEIRHHFVVELDAVEAQIVRDVYLLLQRPGPPTASPVYTRDGIHFAYPAIMTSVRQ